MAKQTDKVEKNTVKKMYFSIRQFFYNERKYDENLIKSLERTYGVSKKSKEEWIEILSSKGITF